MTAQKAEPAEPGTDQGDAVNEVRLRGRLADSPRLRTLPSGDSVWNLRVVVDRPPVAPGTERPRQRIDSLECAIWSGRLKRQVEKWEAGDVVEVSGALRRRFFRVGGAAVSRVEVELSAGRRLRRAGAG
jgi:single-strand DNA-binding protein